MLIRRSIFKSASLHHCTCAPAASAALLHMLFVSQLSLGECCGSWTEHFEVFHNWLVFNQGSKPLSDNFAEGAFSHTTTWLIPECPSSILTLRHSPPIYRKVFASAQLDSLVNHGAPRKPAPSTGRGSTETSRSKYLQQDWTSRRSKFGYRRKNDGASGQTTTTQSQLLGPENGRGEANLQALIEEFRTRLVGGFLDDITLIMGITGLVSKSSE